MNHRQLQYFVEVYKEKSISSAARKLYISPQGVSRAIHDLENDLNHKLFTRSGNRMIPTQFAVHLLPHARAILAEYHLIEDGQLLSHAAVKTLHLLAPYDSLQLIPAEFYRDFYSEYPGILLHIAEVPDAHIMNHLDSGRIELSFLSGPLDFERYDADPVGTSRFVLMIPRNHPLAEKESITSADLNGVALTIKGSSHELSAQQMDRFLSEGGRPETYVELTDARAISAIVKAGLSVGMLLDYLGEQYADESVVIRPFAHPDLTKTVYLTRVKNTVLSPEAEYFRTFLLEWLKRV